jgi:hypothetical protein
MILSDPRRRSLDHSVAHAIIMHILLDSVNLIGLFELLREGLSAAVSVLHSIRCEPCIRANLLLTNQILAT